MNFTNFTNRDLMTMLANVASIFRSKPVDSEKITEDYIGLAIAKSYFYGIKNPDGNYQALGLSNVVFNSKNNVTLQIEGVVKLQTSPVNIGAGDIVYAGYGLLVINSVTIYDGRSVNTITSSTLQEAFAEATDPVNVDVNMLFAATSEIAFQEDPIYQEGDKYTYVNLDGVSTNGLIQASKVVVTPISNDPTGGHFELIPTDLMSIAEANKLEYDGDYLYFTDSLGVRRQLAFVS